MIPAFRRHGGRQFLSIEFPFAYFYCCSFVAKKLAIAPRWCGKYLFYLEFVRRNKSVMLPASPVTSLEGTLEARTTGQKNPAAPFDLSGPNSAAVCLCAWFLSFVFL